MSMRIIGGSVLNVNRWVFPGIRLVIMNGKDLNVYDEV